MRMIMMNSPISNESGPVQDIRRVEWMRRMKLVTPESEEQAHCGAPKDAPTAFGKQLVSAGSLYGT